MIETVVKSLRSNGFKPVEFVEKANDAVPLVLDLIPPRASIEMAGSASVAQIGLLDLLRERGNPGLEPPQPGKLDPRTFLDEMRAHRKDVLLASSNAVTMDGKLVNVDGMGNRVGNMFFGVKQVVLLVGVNKIVNTVDEALDRVQHTIAPYHAKHIGVNTPCAVTGECSDCNSPQRICNITTIISKKPPSLDFAIILVGEDLGLGWDPSWPDERKERIAAPYRAEMEKFRAAYPAPPRK